MSISSLYKNYFQKSRVFLFPMLGIRKGPLTTPLESYISWKDQIQPGDYKLICLYNTADPRHERVEQEQLFANALFERFAEVEAQDRRAYIFNLDIFKQDFDHFLNGHYSELSLPVKNYIINYFGRKSPEFHYIETFLFPYKFYEVYAHLLNVDERLLCEVVELCDKYDPEKENLKLIEKYLESSTKSL